MLACALVSRSLALVFGFGLVAACGGGVAAERPSGAAGEGGAPPCVQCGAGSAGDDEAGAGGSPADAGSGGDAGAGGQSGSPTTDVSIAEISFWQTLRIPLELSGAPVQPNAPVVIGKSGVLRVYVAPPAAFEARSLSVELELDAALAPLTSTKLVRAVSVDAQFTSTFNFPIDGDQVRADTRYSVTLRDGAGGRVLERYPSRGQSALGAVQVPGNGFDVTVVPIRVRGWEPDVSAKNLTIFRDRVRALYPLADVRFTLHAPVSPGIDVGPEAGWDELLDYVYTLRASEAPAGNVFYYGLFTPAPRFDDYCASDCTVGYSVVAEPTDVESRGSLGLGIFSDGSNEGAPDTMAHELGHALGREHAPCDVAKPDSGPFPYLGGKIGVWGFDAPKHRLLDPQLYGDVMGYCVPSWISDYTYRALFRRIEQVNAEVTVAKSLRPSAPVGVYRRVLLRADGSLHWGSSFAPKRIPAGEVRELSLLGAQGQRLRVVDVPFRRFGDARGGFLLLPEAVLGADSGVRAIGVGRARLALPAR